MEQQILLIVSEPEQVADAATYWRDNKMSPIVLACDFWAERLLEAEGVPFVSISATVQPWEDKSVLIAAAETAAREWYRIPEMRFFEHDKIRIAESLEPALEKYTGQALLYIDMFSRAFDALPHVTRLVVLRSKKLVPPSGSALAAFEIRIAADTACFVAQERGLQCDIIGEISEEHVTPFPPRHGLQTFLVGFFNFLVRTFTKPKQIRIFASEYWSHIAEVMAEMGDAELVLMDRSEVRNIPYRELLRHRMRFMHPLAERTENIVADAAARQREFKREWGDAKKVIATLPIFVRGDRSWWPLVEGAFEFVVGTYAERIVSDIEAIRTILLREKTNRVLLRASTGLHQHHFFLIAHLSYRLGIPSVEVQHGIGTFEASSPDSVLTASYLASYGALLRRVYVDNYALAPERIRPIGSPRFDSYARERGNTSEARAQQLRALGLDPDQLVVVVPVPAEMVSLAFDHFSSYEVASVVRTLAQVRARLPAAQFLFKFRGGTGYPSSGAMEYVRTLFGKSAGIAKEEAVFPLLCAADIVLTPRSTVLCEAVIAGKPLVLYPWRRHDPHLAIYRPAGIAVFSAEEIAQALEVLSRDAAFRERTLEDGRRFLFDNFVFDGASAARLATMLREDLKVFPPVSTQGQS